MKRLAFVSLFFLWVFQAASASVFARTPFDRGSVQGIFEEEEAFLDSRYLPLEEEVSSDKSSR